MKMFIYLFAAILLTVSIANAQETIINILHINDTHSNYLPGGSRDANLKGTIGGMAKATSVIGYARQMDSEALVFHAGDLFSGDLFFYLNYGVPELLWMKQMGFNAITLGNHEFDLTTGALIQSIEYAYKDGGVPIISSNLKANTETGEKLKSMIKSWDTTTVHGVKVGYFGLTSPEANFSSSPDPDIYVFDSDAQVIMDKINEQVELLKSLDAKLIIFLSHLGLDGDIGVASMFNDIDIIIGGHDHYELKEPRIIGNTYIVQAGAFFENVGQIQVKMNDGKLSEFKYNLVKLDESVPEEPNVSAMLDELINSQDEKIKSLFNVKIADVTETFDEDAIKLNYTGDHTTAVGSFISDALRDYGKTDIGFTVGGLSTQPLYKGPIVAQDIIKMIGYGVNETTLMGYNIVKFDISGYALKEGLKFCLSYLESGDEYYPQVSGMTYKYHMDTVGLLTEVLINGSPISDSQTYSLTTNYAVYKILEFIKIPVENIDILKEVSEFDVVLGYVANKGTLQPLKNGMRAFCEFGPKSVGVNDPILSLNNLSVFPNPTNDLANIEFSIEKSGNYSINLFNLENLETKSLGNQFFETGRNMISLSLKDYISGKYLVRIKNDGNIIYGKFVICK
jgi:2',3'-cyclic-nucleotide 2'-phosphodiesterase (5'-nucleotidase family)